MYLPYKKCKCCGKRIGFLEWCRWAKGLYKYLKTQGDYIAKDDKISKEDFKKELIIRARENYL